MVRQNLKSWASLTSHLSDRSTIYLLCCTAKTHYGTSLANVDWLHGSAESLLTITNLLIVLGLRQGIRDASKKEGQEGEKLQEGEGNKESN
jgi:hypothetical protein